MFFVDAWRVLLIAVNGFCLIVLTNRFVKYRQTWKEETRDLWVTLVLWSVSAIVLSVQGLAEHRHVTATLVFVTFASLATPMVLRRKERERRSFLDE